jgi:hypothetical protein
MRHRKSLFKYAAEPEVRVKKEPKKNLYAVCYCCSKMFQIKPSRIERSNGGPFCSHSCSQKLRHRIGDRPLNQFRSEILELTKKEAESYESK